ncbi:MAG: hypothetical protein ACRD0M_06875, partial [Acidimicrobiales bacterium]
ACGPDDEPPATAPATTTTVATPTTAPPATGVPATSTTVAARTIEVTVQGGSIVGGGRHQVSRGETVRLVVTSDVADEIHVHGFDRRATVAAGGTAEIVFVADLAGTWEIELESRRRRLLTLEVRP